MMLVSGVALASELPGYDPLDRVIPNTGTAIVGKLVAVTNEQTRSDNLLKVTIEPSRTLWGQTMTNAVSVVYKEFIAKLPDEPGLNVDFINYTGSGIEFQAKAGVEYICLLKKEETGFSLLRLEPVSNEKRVLEVYEKQKKTPQQTPAGDSSPRGAGLGTPKK